MRATSLTAEPQTLAILGFSALMRPFTADALLSVCENYLKSIMSFIFVVLFV